MSVDLRDFTIATARAALAAGDLSAVELTESALAKIELRNGELRAYLQVDPEGARAQAERADALLRDGSAGPLAGIPICVKDVIDVVGFETTAGAEGWRRTPRADAPAAGRLRAAGAVILGKGNTNEFAFGIDGRNPHWGDCRNPIDPIRISGGSTAGPACATVAGMALGGIGTDTSGSLRVPASLCGLVSVRTTYGAVPTTGVVPLAWSYDTVGPIAKTPEDAALLLAGLGTSVPEGSDPKGTERLDGARIGLAEGWLGDRCEPAVADGVRAMADRLRSRGAEIRRVDLSHLNRATPVHQPIQFADAATAHEPWFESQHDHYERAVRLRLEAGRTLPATAYATASRAREALARKTAAVLEDLDAILAPATPISAPPLDAETVGIAGTETPIRSALLSFTVPLNQQPGPVVVVPAGESDGLPFGAQLAGKPGSDHRLLEIAALSSAA